MRDHRSLSLPPSPWVVRFAVGIATGGSVLDVACGAGRHVRLLLAAGHPLTAVDRDLSAIVALGPDPRLELIEADLEAGARPPFAGRQFAGVVTTNYLWRPLLPAIVAAVADDGVLIYETFAAGNEAFGRPSNPDFLLQPGELLEAVRGRLIPVAFEHARIEAPARIVQRLCAVGQAHVWAKGHTA